MKKALAGFLFVACCGAGSAEPVDFAKPELTPIPAKMTYDAKTSVPFGAEQTIAVACPDETAAERLRRHLQEWFGFSPRIVRMAGDVTEIPAEGFRLVARPDGISVSARDLQGVRYAAFALRQAVEREAVGETVRGYRLPALEIDDRPRFAFRGLHIAWFPETTGDFVERTIRLAASYRFNYIVLESFGVFKSERHPWFSRPDSPMTVTEIRRLVAIGKDLGVTLVPQLQIFGHSTFARGRSGKHNVLDTHPERASLFEPGNGFVWCLSNPDARRTIVDLADELHEAFGRPPYMHIGCDEADPPSCAACRAQPYVELFFSHFTAVCDHLRAKGARAMMWHDMLLKAGDPRWKGFQANGTDETEALLPRLPKDVVICDWHYGKSDLQESEPKSQPTLDHFKASGLDVLTCPWDDPVATMAQGRYAAKIGLFGVMGTLWNHYRGRAFAETVMAQACAAWGADEAPRRGYYGTLSFCNHWRQIGWDMKSGDYRNTGITDDQTTRSILAE